MNAPSCTRDSRTEMDLRTDALDDHSEPRQAIRKPAPQHLYRVKRWNGFIFLGWSHAKRSLPKPKVTLTAPVRLVDDLTSTKLESWFRDLYHRGMTVVLSNPQNLGQTPNFQNKYTKPVSSSGG